VPCDQIITTKVKLKAESTETLEEALKAAGYTVRRYGTNLQVYGRGEQFSINDGELVTTKQGQKAADLANSINRAYSTTVLKQQAKKYGWQVTEVKAKTGAIAFQVKKKAL
jgi:hypothetical protein